MATVPSEFSIGGEFTVNRLGFGAMRLTGERIIGRPTDEATACTVLQRAVELGVTFIDTADSYGPGVSERLIRKALTPYPDELIVATKGGLLRNRSGEWLPCGDPDYLRDAVLSSLDRLGVEKIDLYQLHRPDPEVPYADSITALAELQDDGVIGQLGVSNVTVEQLEEARSIADIATVQNRYNVASRDDERVLKACEDADIGFIPWAPIDAGTLEDPTVEQIAANHDATPYQIGLAWLLHHSPVILPIPGTSSVDHLEENVAAREIKLSDAEYDELTH
ncbi:aldo/keto reductase [Halocatena halophila]|uniref:aldo/keto reductase n=1 Tax=Halocatena halophila TaxID=2814576 RepID=UPI002ED5064A